MTCFIILSLVLLFNNLSITYSTTTSSSTVIYSLKGEETTLYCPYNNSNGEDIEWYKLNNNNGYQYIDDTLLYNNDTMLMVNDTGTYTCSISHDNNMERKTYSCPMIVKEGGIDSQFILNPSNITIHEGYTAVLQCQPPLSYPTPNVYWLKDNVPLNISSLHYSLSPTSGNLYIYKTNSNDEGLYKCVAVNTLTGEERVSTGGYLTIGNDWRLLYPSNFSLQSRDATVIEGSTHHIECLINIVSVTYEWSRVGHSSLPPSANSTINTSLIFTSVQESDAGIYSCIYTPSYGSSIYNNVTITVVAPPNISLTNSYNKLNSTSSVTCYTPQHSLPVNVTILVNGNTLYHTIYHNISYYTFNIPSTQYSKGSADVIWVQCIMTNLYGCDTNTLNITIEDIETEIITTSTVSTTTLQATPTPIITTPTPIITTPTITITQSSTDSNILYCNVTLVTPMNGSIAWKSGTNTLASTEVISGILYIVLELTVTSTGYYYCLWTPWMGEYMFSLLQVTYTPPVTVPPPTQIPLTVSVPVQTVTGYEGQHVNITCIFNGPQLNIVFWTRQNDNKILSNSYMIQNNDNSTVVILSLGPLTVEEYSSTSYQCVGSVSSEVVSSQSILLSVMIQAPLYPPVSLQAEWIPSINVLLLTWSPPITNNSRILGYKLNWNIFNDKHQLSHSARTAVSYDTLFYSLRDVLVVGQRYSFSVWAYTLGGDGPPTIINKILPASQLPTPTPVVAMTTDSMAIATPIPSNDMLPIDTTCHALTPTLGRVEIQGLPNAVRYTIQYTCSTGRHGNTSISPTFGTSIILPVYNIYPGSLCTVTSTAYNNEWNVLGYGTCSLITPHNNNNNTHVNVSLQWNRQGILMIDVSLSQILSLLAGIVQYQWRPISSTTQWFNSDSLPILLYNITDNDTIEFRVKLNSQVIYTSSLTAPPPSPSPSLTVIHTPHPSSSDNTGYYGNVWLTYGIGIVLLIIVCLIAVVFIMSLKLIQNARREKNKITDHRRRKNKVILKSSPSCNSNKTLSDVNSFTDLRSSLASPLSSDNNYIRIIKVRRIDTDV